MARRRHQQGRERPQRKPTVPTTPWQTLASTKCETQTAAWAAQSAVFATAAQEANTLNFYQPRCLHPRRKTVRSCVLAGLLETSDEAAMRSPGQVAAFNATGFLLTQLQLKRSPCDMHPRLSYGNLNICAGHQTEQTNLSFSSSWAIQHWCLNFPQEVFTVQHDKHPCTTQKFKITWKSGLPWQSTG